MARNENYPDDIRMYDNVPGSPFYEDPNEWMHDAATELGQKWEDALKADNYIEELDWDRADVDVDRGDQELSFYLEEKAYKYIEAYPDDFHPNRLEWD